MYFQGQVCMAEISAAVRAFLGEELTLKEFRAALDLAGSEVLQLEATVLGCYAASLPHPSARLRIGRAFCLAHALQRGALLN